MEYVTPLDYTTTQEEDSDTALTTSNSTTTGPQIRVYTQRTLYTKRPASVVYLRNRLAGYSSAGKVGVRLDFRRLLEDDFVVTFQVLFDGAWHSDRNYL